MRRKPPSRTTERSKEEQGFVKESPSSRGGSPDAGSASGSPLSCLKGATGERQRKSVEEGAWGDASRVQFNAKKTGGTGGGSPEPVSMVDCLFKTKTENFGVKKIENKCSGNFCRKPQWWSSSSRRGLDRDDCLKNFLTRSSV